MGNWNIVNCEQFANGDFKIKSRDYKALGFETNQKMKTWKVGKFENTIHIKQHENYNNNKMRIV